MIDRRPVNLMPSRSRASRRTRPYAARPSAARWRRDCCQQRRTRLLVRPVVCPGGPNGIIHLGRGGRVKDGVIGELGTDGVAEALRR